MVKKSKILIVDDEQINIKAIYSLFKSEYDISGVTSGLEAISFIKTKKPDIILMDIMMPDMNGIETYRRIKNLPDFSDIPVIFITGVNDEKYEKECFELGAVDFINKPIKPNITRLRVQNHIKLKTQSDILKEMTYIDGLTLLYNRRYFEEMFLKEWKRCARNKQSLSIIILDIDFFKQFNDTYGHIEGDECLKKVANALKETLHRAGDFVARFGGEEFICLLPSTDIDGLKPVAENILNSVRNLSIEHKSSLAESFVTISGGATSVIPQEDSIPEVLLQNADILLYNAKKNGRNRVEIKEMPMN